MLNNSSNAQRNFHIHTKPILTWNMQLCVSSDSGETIDIYKLFKQADRAGKDTEGLDRQPPRESIRYLDVLLQYAGSTVASDGGISEKGEYGYNVC